MYNCLKLQKKSCSTDAVQQKRIICLTVTTTVNTLQCIEQTTGNIIF